MKSFRSVFEKQRCKASILRSENYKARKKRLLKLEKWILQHRGALHQALHQDLMKSDAETDLTEIYTVLTEIREAISNLNWWTRKEYATTPITFLGSVAYHIYEPKGVCLIISPWNYPFNLAIGPVVSALAAGNTFILKPSEYTPATSALIRRMVDELFEEDLGWVAEGDGKVAEHLLQLPFDHIFFTGSERIGKIVMEAAARNLSSVTLELGGKSPTIIDQTAHLKDAAQKIAWGKWLNAGQTCVAPDYLLIQAKVYDEFLKLLLDHAQAAYPKGDYTGIVNETHYNRLKEMIDQAEKSGAKKHEVGMETENRKMSPVVLENPTDEMLIMQEEIFGPVLPVLKYTRLQEVIDYINNHPKPLSLYLFSRSRSHQEMIRKNTSSGTMVINDVVIQFAHPGLAFGGVNSSGFGKGHGRDGFLTFSNKKSVLKQTVGFTMAKLLYPPYTRWRKWLIDKVLKYL